MNSIFEKNLQALALKDSEFASRLASFIVTDVPQLVKENGFFNLIYKDIYLHNRINPVAEAKEIFQNAENAPVAIHLIYGMGLGYLFQVASANSTGTVILYESDLNILKIAFTLVDFSKDILKNNVFITDNIDKLGEYIHQKSNTKNLPLLLSTKASREIDENRFNEIVSVMQRMVGRFSLDLKYTQQRFYPLVKDIINNIPKLTKQIPLSVIRDYYKGQTAVVVSAGPTLDRNIDTIKKYRDNIVLIVVGTALKTIARHGITPDFLCIIESYDSAKQVEGIDLSNVNFVTEPYSNANLLNFKYKQVYSHISNNMPINYFWSNLIDEKIDDYFSKGTVSYTALNTARLLGCSKIVMVGQDLAYVEGQCYSKDSAYKDLECRFNKEKNKWEITAKDFEAFANALSNSPDANVRTATAERRLNNLNNSLYYIKGINGDNIPTESVYAAFLEPLSEFTSVFNDRVYINTSLVGAQINGYENMSLEEALKDTIPIANREIINNYKFDIDKLTLRIKEEIFNINRIRNQELVSAKNALKTLNNDFKRFKNPTVEVLQDLKKVSKLYLELSSSNENTLYDFITAAERIEVDYIMKMTNDFNNNTITVLINKYSEYFNKAEQKIAEITEMLENTLRSL